MPSSGVQTYTQMKHPYVQHINNYFKRFHFKLKDLGNSLCVRMWGGFLWTVLTCLKVDTLEDTGVV